MAYDYLNQPVITSQLCFQRDAESFFHPVELGHTGYAFDGYSYSSGTKGTTTASWFSEPQGATRGPLQEFPAQALVLVSRASITILDATTEALNLWMLFYFADQNAYANNSQTAVAGYVASSVTWANGLLSIVMTPDAGSTPQAAVVLTIDFVQDTVYLDTSI